MATPASETASAVRGWELLWSALPEASLKPLSELVYGVKGLTDVNEGYLIERLHTSGLPWSERLLGSQYLGSEERTTGSGKKTTYYLAQVDYELTIAGKTFVGSGAHDNRKLDAAFKGAKTVAFKQACKSAGLTIQLFKDGKAMDFFYEDAQQGSGQAPPPPTPNGSNGAAAQPGPPAATGDRKLELLMELASGLPGPGRGANAMALVMERSRQGTSLEKIREDLISAHRGACGERCVHALAVIASWPPQ